MMSCLGKHRQNSLTLLDSLRELSVINPRLPISKCQWVGSGPVMGFWQIGPFHLFQKGLEFKLVTQFSSLRLRSFFALLFKATEPHQDHNLSFLFVFLGGPKKITQWFPSKLSQLFIIIHKSCQMAKIAKITIFVHSHPSLKNAKQLTQFRLT